MLVLERRRSPVRQPTDRAGEGCMTDRVLAVGLLQALRARRLYRLALANDGGTALGQVADARHVITNESASAEGNRHCQAIPVRVGK
ncbi:hypothetical protein REMIM1_PE00485 (plasmid) [Rhizobium etli bv. mimosae str. Mim1]|nr:hypothetical protein REMIM1_PE00485 [Rhizobium etli bv. mimosae str. Mim1]